MIADSDAPAFQSLSCHFPEDSGSRFHLCIVVASSDTALPDRPCVPSHPVLTSVQALAAALQVSTYLSVFSPRLDSL